MGAELQETRIRSQVVRSTTVLEGLEMGAFGPISGTHPHYELLVMLLTQSLLWGMMLDLIHTSVVLGHISL